MKPWDTLYAATSTCIIKTGSTIKTTPHSWPPSSAFPNHGAPKLAVQVLPFLVYLNQTKIQQYLSLVVGSFGECFSDSSVTRMGVVPSVARWRGPDQDEVWRFQADNEAHPSNHPPWLVFGMVYQRKMKTQTETTIQPQLHHVLRNMKKPFLLSFDALDLLVRKFIVLVWCHACSWSHSSCSHRSCRLFVSIYDCINLYTFMIWQWHRGVFSVQPKRGAGSHMWRRSAVLLGPFNVRKMRLNWARAVEYSQNFNSINNIAVLWVLCIPSMKFHAHAFTIHMNETRPFIENSLICEEPGGSECAQDQF